MGLLGQKQLLYQMVQEDLLSLVLQILLMSKEIIFRSTVDQHINIGMELHILSVLEWVLEEALLNRAVLVYLQIICLLPVKEMMPHTALNLLIQNIFK